MLAHIDVLLRQILHVLGETCDAPRNVGSRTYHKIDETADYSLVVLAELVLGRVVVWCLL